MGTEWHYLAAGPGDGDEAGAGPVDEAGLARLLRDGQITSVALIRPAGETDWRPLKDRLPELGAEPPPPDFNHGPMPAPPGSDWVDTAPHPWRRYFARLLDGLVVSWLTVSVGLEVLAVASPAAAHGAVRMLIDPEQRWFVALFMVALTVPVIGLMIGSTGLTVGKWLFGVKVVRPDGRPIGVLAGLRREFLVWSCGQAVGLPIICIFTAWTGYKALRDDGHTLWDQPEDSIVIHRRAGPLQLCLIVLGVTATLLIFSMLAAHV